MDQKFGMGEWDRRAKSVRAILQTSPLVHLPAKPPNALVTHPIFIFPAQGLFTAPVAAYVADRWGRRCSSALSSSRPRAD